MAELDRSLLNQSIIEDEVNITFTWRERVLTAPFIFAISMAIHIVDNYYYP